MAHDIFPGDLITNPFMRRSLSRKLHLFDKNEMAAREHFDSAGPWFVVSVVKHLEALKVPFTVHYVIAPEGIGWYNTNLHAPARTNDPHMIERPSDAL